MKKKMYCLLAIGCLCITAFAWTQSSNTSVAADLRPLQIAMQERAGWLKAMNANLTEMKFEEVQTDAVALATQAETMAGALANPLAKELTLKVSNLAKEVADAAVMQDGEIVTMKLADIKATCGECHEKIRDKK